MRTRCLALDLEGTLISNAVSQFPRPGLGDFLDYCFSHFEKVVMFTCVPRKLTFEILHGLEIDGVISAGAHSKLGYVDWDRHEEQYKDLKHVRPQHGFCVDECLIVDDDFGFIDPAQYDLWVPIQDYLSPYSLDDRELQRVQSILESRIAPHKDK